jgi:FGGY-family pentulose kinase
MYFIGVDVGTLSVRAAVFDQLGSIQGISIIKIKMYQDGSRCEQSSDSIWNAVCSAVKTSISSSKVEKELIMGIGFDATCSLVALGHDFEPFSVGADHKDASRNVIMWMDHRAVLQASRLTKSAHKSLDQIGGIMSPEMSIAKVIWIYQNLSWKDIGHLMELPDYLTWKATGSELRGLVQLVCKWTFVADGLTKDWDPEFWISGGVNKEHVRELLTKCCSDTEKFSVAGNHVGFLSSDVCVAFGLDAHLKISVSGAVIDAYAGALGSIGVGLDDCKLGPTEMSHRMAVISGTSTCHIVLSRDKITIPGIWGPYPNILIDGCYCLEGGQTLTGKAIETFLSYHPVFPQFSLMANESNDSIFELLNKAVLELCRDENLDFPAEITRNVHIYPDLQGNRAPIADPLLRGMICGLPVPKYNPQKIPPHTLVSMYYSALLGLCYGTKHILESFSDAGCEITEIVLSGGLGSNSLWAQSLADVTGCSVLMGSCLSDHTALLGSAILAASSTHHLEFGTNGLWSIMRKMSNLGKCFLPDPATATFHGKKYTIYLKMIKAQQEFRQIMSQY